MSPEMATRAEPRPVSAGRGDRGTTGGAGPGGIRSGDRRRLGPRWLGPVALVAVLAVALVIGSGVLNGSHPTAAQRAHALETNVRCPSCIDISVADSQAATAASLRHQILTWVRQGRSDQAIENALVARYGLSILLRPPTDGFSVVVWVVPAVAGAVALAAVGTLFWRRSREMRALTSSPPAAGQHPPSSSGSP